MSRSLTNRPESPNPAHPVYMGTSTNVTYIGVVNLRYVTGADGLLYPAYVWETYEVITPSVFGDNELHAEGES